MDYMAYAFMFLFGAIIGSFLNVCIYRIPIGKSIISPPSSCPNCGRRLRPLELIPIFSFIFQKGQCKGCQSPISWQYTLVEFLTGLAFVLVFAVFGMSYLTLKILVFFTLILVVSLIDLQLKIIPNILSIPGVAIGLLLSYQHILDSLLGTLCGFAIIAVVIIASRGGMGWGDAKLLAMVGAFWGWQAVLYTLFLGSLLGSVVGIGLLLIGKIKRKTHIPFGPFLGLGSLIAILIILDIIRIRL